MKKEEKSDWHLTRGTADDHINKVIKTVRTERLPNRVNDVVVFGSFMKEKLYFHDVDVMIVINEPEPEDYREAAEVFHKLIKYTCFDHYLDDRYYPWNITKRLIRRGMRGVDLNRSYDRLSGDALLMFIRCLGDNERLLKSGFPMKVVWSRTWDKKIPKEEHPLMPYLRYMQMINNAGIYGSMKKIDERIKALSTYDGGDWKALLNKEEKRCYDDTIYGQTEHDELERERRLLEREQMISKQRQYEIDRMLKEWKADIRSIKILKQKLDKREQKIDEREREFMMILSIGKKDPDMFTGMLKKYLRQARTDNQEDPPIWKMGNYDLGIIALLKEQDVTEEHELLDFLHIDRGDTESEHVKFLNQLLEYLVNFNLIKRRNEKITWIK